MCLNSGTGDLCAALFLAWTADCNLQNEVNLPECLEKVVATMQCVIKRTRDAIPSGLCYTELVHAKELKIIASKRDIEDPPVSTYKAYAIHSK